MRDFHRPGRSAVFATNGMCATSHPLAAKTAVSILESGGNAMDAAIAGAVLLGLCEPQMTGIGGDCFALVSKPDHDVVAINGSGRAAAGMNAAALRDAGHSTVPVDTPDAVTIPGAIDAFCHMSDAYGKLGLADSLAPAIRYMESGVPIAPRVAFDLKTGAERLTEHGRTHYLLNGKTPTTGDIFALPGQAEVLRRIAKDGRDAFYTGEIAEDMVQTLQKAGGCQTLDDFAACQTTTAAPISGTYKDRELLEHPPNGQGATAILLLNILSQFDLAAMDPFGTQRTHIEAEATKLAYDTRNRFMSDADYMTRLDHMTSMDTARDLAALIDPARAMPSATTISEAVHKDTIYITVVDKDRMAVSLIYSIFHGFGSGIASEKFGILFHNRGAGFSLEQGHPNEMAPGKRPMHTIIPGILRGNGQTMPFGVMGGQYQANGHGRVITNMVDYGMDPQSALDAPRAFAEGDTLSVERGYSDEVRQELADLGHNVIIPETAIGGAQAIVAHDNGVLEGASDPRKDGCALGY